MILFCGIPSEPPLALAIQAAIELGLEHLVLNQRSLPFYDIRLCLVDGRLTGELWASERVWPVQAFTGAYTRLMDVQDLPESRPRRTGFPQPDGIQKGMFFDGALQAWLEVADCRVVNRQRPSSSNVSKPHQMQLIQRAGFLTPTTLVTNVPAEVTAFARLHGRVIYKSISSVRSIVHELTDERMSDLDRIRDLPTQFQALIAGDDVRVHVVGTRVFATRIRTEATDYRYAQHSSHDVEMQPFTMPPEIETRCLALSRTLELPFCGIDFKVTSGGEYYCLEVNPSPAYSYYQETAGQPIARALVEFLAGRDPDVSGARTHGHAGAGASRRESVGSHRRGPASGASQGVGGSVARHAGR